MHQFAQTQTEAGRTRYDRFERHHPQRIRAPSGMLPAAAVPGIPPASGSADGSVASPLSGRLGMSMEAFPGGVLERRMARDPA
jgi:hypothetical protein